jgi:hypothetical protein
MFPDLIFPRPSTGDSVCQTLKSEKRLVQTILKVHESQCQDEDLNWSCHTGGVTGESNAGDRRAGLEAGPARGSPLQPDRRNGDGGGRRGLAAGMDLYWPAPYRPCPRPGGGPPQEPGPDPAPAEEDQDHKSLGRLPEQMTTRSLITLGDLRLRARIADISRHDCWQDPMFLSQFPAKN